MAADYTDKSVSGVGSFQSVVRQLQPNCNRIAPESGEAIANVICTHNDLSLFSNPSSLVGSDFGGQVTIGRVIFTISNWFLDTQWDVLTAYARFAVTKG
jgi:hypothetical protein